MKIQMFDAHTAMAVFNTANIPVNSDDCTSGIKVSEMGFDTTDLCIYYDHQGPNIGRCRLINKYVVAGQRLPECKKLFEGH